MKSPKLLSLVLSIIVTTLVVFLGVSADWAGPLSEPPAGNVDAPINVGGNAQSKSGGLIVGAGLTAGQTALIVPTGNLVVGILSGVHAAPNGSVGGNISVNDVYIRSLNKWASELSTGPAPEVAPTAYCAGVAYDADNAYCQDGTIYTPGMWIPLDNDSNNQTDPNRNWSSLITKQITFPVKTCKLKTTSSFNDGGFITVFSGVTRLAFWERAFSLDNTDIGFSSTVKDQNNQVCGGAVVGEGESAQTLYTSTLPHMDGGILKWCGYVMWRHANGSGSAGATEFTVNQAKGAAATVYSAHALGDGGDNHSYTLYGQYCN
ncbi:MAG: hypothetical protein UT41_C0001G0077 [Candidatus Wolfebacteria bacterium GW2011_GWC2_39_22]|uniref:Uncharacterized protein n=1 Tax=Candidatus Wolfebacteria bacterium GW2011_GWC2_39_22 TaxID=1619013 RepID=A0A0G0NAN0_9BACT|nr:MAG: hypothetical protein UT41_C0001G0077 [Candidatus Wolfebacteria bacterium GW2011_GWC2_39_22]HBI25737.1 hypothetical protein [Candidatus Wolfebacteria bacterium]